MLLRCNSLIGIWRYHWVLYRYRGGHFEIFKIDEIKQMDLVISTEGNECVDTNRGDENKCKGVEPLGVLEVNV